MNSEIYTTMMEQMEAGTFTEVAAKKTINKFFARQQITEDEYDELMDKADTLATNTEDGDTLARIVALEDNIKALQEQVAAIKQAVEGGSTEIPDVGPTQTGAEFDPIDAVAGMSYEKDKYYRDPTNKEVYLCTVSVAYAGLPHEAVNVYFNWAYKD